MRGHDCLSAACLALAASLAGCASRATHAPPTFLPEPKQAGAATHGSWIELTIATEGAATHLAGELLAVTPESVWVTTRPDSLRSVNSGYVVARRAITDGRLAWYDADPATIHRVAILGTLTTISNGAFLIFTAPAWMITGTIAGNAYAREPLILLAPDTGRDLRPFARFPLGIPNGLDASFTRLGQAERDRSPKSPAPARD